MFASFAPARRRQLAGNSRATRGVVVNSVPWGLASGRVACRHGGRAFRVAGVGLRMHVRAREGTGGGSAWQVWENVHLDVGARAFHVAGVGTGGHRRCRERGFAWPAWGSVHAACVSRGRRGEWCDRWPRWASFCVAGAGNRALQLKQLDFVAPCENSALRARVHALGVAKSWQAQGIRGLVDVSLEWTSLGTQWQAVGIGVGRVACAGDC